MLIRSLANELRKRLPELTGLPFKSHPNKFAGLRPMMKLFSVAAG
jgi:hypothetical protein